MIIFSDLHLHTTHPVAGSDFLEIGVNSLRQVEKFAVENNEQFIIHCGDWSHLKDRIHTKVWNSFFEEINSWNNEGLISYWLKGNHDFLTDTSIKSFIIHPNMIPIYEPTVKFINGLQCVFLPFGSKVEELKQLPIDSSQKVIVFGHDFLRGKSMISDTLVSAEGWELSDFDKYNFVFLGHSHTPQEIVPNEVFHVGSPYQVSFNEMGQEKYFIQFDGSNIVKHQFTFPKFTEINLEEDYEIESNTYVKLKFNVSKHTEKEIFLFKDELLHKGVLKVKIEPQYDKVEKKERMRIKKDAKDIDFMERYVSLHKGDLEEEVLCKIGQNIINGGK